MKHLFSCLAVTALAACLLGGCGSNAAGTPSALDAGEDATTEAGLDGGDLADAIEAGANDAGVDVAIIDSSAPDSATADAAMPDAASSDSATSDSGGDSEMVDAGPDSGAGCVIAGMTYPAGATATTGCLTCVPSNSTTSWTPVCPAAEVCNQTSCQSGCVIAGAFYAAGASIDDGCEVCAPATSTSSWTQVAGPASCPAGEVCNGGGCAAGCSIGGIFYPSGASNPTDACEICQPAKSLVAWGNLADGTICATGMICNGGYCAPPPWTPTNNGLWGGVVNSVAIDPTSSANVYAATTDGIYKSSNGGASWAQLPGMQGQSVTALAFAPDGSALHAAWSSLASGTAAIAKSTDGGNTWVSAKLPTESSIRHLMVAPSSTAIVLAAGDTVLRSSDSGATYTSTGAGPSQVYQVGIHPTNPLLVYAAANSGGFYRSGNGGTSWTQSTTGLPDTNSGYSVAVDPSNPATIYYGKGNYPKNGLFRSTDGGVTFAALTGSTNFPYSIAVDPANSNIVLAGGYDNGVFRSANGGATWSKMTMPAFDNNAIQSITFAASNPSVVWVGEGYGFTTEEGLYISANAGSTWTVSNVGLTNTTPTQLVLPTTGTVYANVDLVSKTTDGAASWTSGASGFIERDVTALAFDAAVRTTLYAIDHYQGLFRSVDGGTTWIHLGAFTGTDGNLLVADPTAGGTFWITTYGGNTYRSTDGGNTLTPITTLPGGMVGALAIAAQSSATMYASVASQLYKSVDGGATWSVPNPNPIDLVAIDVNTTDHVLAVGGSVVYATTDGGVTWTSYNPAISTANALVIDPANAMVAYMATTAGVLRSADGGATWASASLGLPPLAIDSLVIDPITPTTLYAGTGGRGVFKTITGGL